MQNAVEGTREPEMGGAALAGTRAMIARGLAWVGLIAILAVMANLAWLRYRPATFDLGVTSYWWPISTNLAHGLGYTSCYRELFPFCGPGNNQTAMREPVPVLLFAAVAAVSNDSLNAAAVVELVLHLGILVLIYALGCEVVGGRRERPLRLVPLLAALVWAVYLPGIELVGQVSGDLLTSLATVLAILLLLRARRRKGWVDWIGAALALGLATNSRSASLALAPALLIGLALWPAGARGLDWRRGVTGVREWIGERAVRLRPLLAPMSLFVVVYALTLAPWGLRNYMVFHKFVLGTTLSGYALFRENYHVVTNDYLRFVNGIEGKQVIDELVARRTDLRGNENEAEMDLVYREEGGRAIAAAPVHYALLSGYRFFGLWFNWGIMQAYGSHDNKSDYIMMAEQAILLLAALVGLAALWWKGLGSTKLWAQAWPLAASVGVVTVTYMAVEGQLRYIVAVMPLTILLAALGAAAIWMRASEGRGTAEGGRDERNLQA